jgi:hypothetical protein
VATLTEFREELRLALQTALNVELLPGKLEGRQHRDLGSVWLESVEAADPILDEVIEAHIRIYLAYDESVTRNPEVPFDPTPLEELVELIQTEVAGVRTTLGPWFVQFVRAEIDPDDQGVEVALAARQLNLAEI